MTLSVLCKIAALAIVWLASTAVFGQSPVEWRRAAERTLQKTSIAVSKSTNSLAANWEFARACFDLAEYATNNAERAELANKGIDAARRAVAIDPNSAAAHFYLAMNIGQLARTKFLAALRLVDQIEREFLRARELDPHFLYGGPDRNLGQLYRDAPSFGSVGSRRKSNEHLQNAVKLEPGYPDNPLTYAESLLKWGDRNGALRELKAADQIWAEARQRFTGPAWEPYWADWQPRRARLAEKLQQPLPGIKSPHAN